MRGTILICILIALFGCESNVIKYESQASMSNARIAVAIGSPQDMYATENFPLATILRPSSMFELPRMVSKGKADFAIINRCVAESQLREDDKLAIVDHNIMESNIAAGFKLNNTKLRDEFNEFLSEFSKHATFKEIITRWDKYDDGGEIPHIDSIINGRMLHVGVCSSSPPFCIIKNGELQGNSIELIKHFALEKGYRIQFFDADFMNLLNALYSEKIDIIISGLITSEERAKSMLFSDIYYRSKSVVIARKEALLNDKDRKRKGIKSTKTSTTAKYIDYTHPTVTPLHEGDEINDDDKIRCYIGSGIVAAVEGTVQEQYLSSFLPSSQIAITKDYSDALLTLISGKSQYMLTNLGTASSFAKAKESVEVVLRDVYNFNTHYGINKKSAKLKAELNTFIYSREKDGTLDRLYNKWLTELDDATMEDVQYAPNSPVLCVGSSCTAVPFSFISNGKSVGLDIEILSLFCKEAGYKLEVQEMPFGALISAITTGKVDLIANTLSATEERRKKIDFSHPYAQNGFALIYSREKAAEHIEHYENPGFIASIKESFIQNIITENRYKLIIDGICVTFIISLLSIILGTIIGAGVCSLNMSKNAILHNLGNVYITIVRGTPVLLILMINFYVVFAQTTISPILVATISFSMNFGAYVSEMFRASIISIDRGQTEAGLAMGFSKLRTFIYIVMPQAIKRVLPVYKGEAISLVKMTSVVGYIAVQDITKVGDIIRSRTFDSFFPLLVSALLYFLIAYIFSVTIDFLTAKYTRNK